MAGLFDIKVLGDKALQMQLNRLSAKGQTNVIRRSFRRSAYRLKAQILLNMSGRIVRERTGTLVGAFERQNPIGRLNRDGTFGTSMILPPRAHLGIEPKDDYYYPTVLEYGAKKGDRPFAAKAPIRRAVNAVQDIELNRIAKEIGVGIMREATKK